MEVCDVYNVLLAIAGPLLLIVLSFFLPNGPITKYQSGSPDNVPTTTRQQVLVAQQSDEKEIFEKFIGAAKKTDDKLQQSYFIQKINSAIQYAISRHDWYEDQRYRIFQAHITISLFAVTTVGVALRTSNTLSGAQEWSLIGAAATSATAIALMVILFNQELDSDRPYRLISDIRFWFYRYVIGNTLSKVDSRDFNKVVQDLRGKRTLFFEKIYENIDLDKSIREDLEQVYILQTLQMHKSTSLTRLRWLLSHYLLLLFAYVMVIFLI